jgi:hypothetical protein
MSKPITPEEVRRWFPEKRRPAAHHCQLLADLLNAARIGREWLATADPLLAEHGEELGLHMREASAALDKMRAHLVAMRQIAPPCGDQPDFVTAAISFAETYLSHYPPASRGRPSTRDWRIDTRGWPETIRQILYDHATAGGKRRPQVSLNASGGPVVAVMQHALARVLGLHLSTARISNALRVWPKLEEQTDALNRASST